MCFLYIYVCVCSSSSSVKFSRKSEGNRLLSKPRHRCEDNIKMDVNVIGRYDVERIKQA
jgi:hypothetical protein